LDDLLDCIKYYEKLRITVVNVKNYDMITHQDKFTAMRTSTTTGNSCDSFAFLGHSHLNII